MMYGVKDIQSQKLRIANEGYTHTQYVPRSHAPGVDIREIFANVNMTWGKLFKT